MTDRKAHTHNSTYPKVAVQWLNQALCFYQSLCLGDSEALRNRHLRVAAKRPMWQNPRFGVAKGAERILPHRFGGLHPQMLLVATRTSHICEFAKSQEWKQTSFLGLRKSAEPLAVSLIEDILE